MERTLVNNGDLTWWATLYVTPTNMLCSLKVPKCEIFDLFAFNDFYVIKSLKVGDLRAEIKN
jgi:hypothetical protein